MDSGIIFALVIAVLFIGGIIWLVIYSRKQSQKEAGLTKVDPSESRPKDQAA